MAERVILHIGSMKSGTTFIQNVLDHNREQLSAEGIHFAGHRWREQVTAVQDLIGHGGADQPPLEPDGPWHTLAATINSTPGTAVVSMEFLAPRIEHKIKIIQDSLEGDLQVVLTGRDLSRNVTAMWQESVQNRSSVPWEAYLAAVRREDRSDPVSRNFWNHQGLAQIAARWSRLVGPDHFTIITVPQKGAPSRLLWDRFAQVLNVSPDVVDFDNVRANPSIGLATALVLRELNERLENSAEPLTAEESRLLDLLVKHHLTKRSLAAHGRDEPKLGLNEKWVMKRGAEEVARLRKAGHRVIGDLDELLPQPVPGIQPSQVSQADQHAAAMAALTRMVQITAQREARSRGRIRKLRQRLQGKRRAARAGQGADAGTGSSR